MVKAVLRQGRIEPVDPLPTDWKDGLELVVEAHPDDDLTLEQIDAIFAKLTAMSASSTPEDEAAMSAAIQEHRREAKDQARREMGL